VTGRPGAQLGSRARTARAWRARSLAIPDRVSLEWFGPWNRRAGVAAETGVGVEVFEVVDDELGGRAHQRHVPGFGSLPADRDCGVSEPLIEQPHFLTQSLGVPWALVS
jgi:hypothetical protein